MANLGVLFHQAELVLSQFAGFEQYLIGNADFADIMQWGGKFDHFLTSLRPTKFTRHKLGIGAYPPYVISGFRVFVGGGIYQAIERFLKGALKTFLQGFDLIVLRLHLGLDAFPMQAFGLAMLKAA